MKCQLIGFFISSFSIIAYVFYNLYKDKTYKNIIFTFIKAIILLFVFGKIGGWL